VQFRGVSVILGNFEILIGNTARIGSKKLDSTMIQRLCQ